MRHGESYNAMQRITIAIDSAQRVSGLLTSPKDAKALLVLGHGAGVGMEHASMAQIADGLAALDVATLRYQFPYIERGSKRPDPPSLCHATIRAAVAKARELSPTLPLFAGGRSFGGRMTSQAQALESLEGVRGLVFFAFPLHPSKQPGRERARHLRDVKIPMLFLQGTRDDLATLDLLRPVVDELAPRATLKILEHADHSFHVLARSGRTNAEVLDEALRACAEWRSGVG
jgi:predicted alpha/beta-hydrolase family hydrolase